MKIVIDLPEEYSKHYKRIYADSDGWTYDAGKGAPLSEVIEDIKAEAYRRGWHDAICKALDETHNYYTEDGVFRAIQEETLIGVGMIMDAENKHISGKESDG